ncbi:MULTISPECIES: hypothetical protein [Saccharothrix]|uniref:hypothetical protein n=1 Tax=Saccharothrix TaxID=2071 RepID=UPI00093F837C|nr:hypothetical protein [Saccharothrix sp. CB00851]OKI38989.1 hypothetical protein A6A25_01970 [Saccharothrix sp. CB00851]
MATMAYRAAVAAALLAEHAEALVGVCAVAVRVARDPASDQGIRLQMGWSLSWESSAGQVARAARALGLTHLLFDPVGDYVRVSAEGPVSTSAGTALVEVWDHVTGEQVGRAAAALGLALVPSTDPVHVAVADVLRLTASEPAAV